LDEKEIKKIRDFLASPELSEVYTGDMESEDTMMFYIMNPKESDCPVAAQKQKDWWKGKVSK
jgi:hypothetical protein